MTIDEAMRQARRALDEKIAGFLADTEIMLRDKGATDGELARELAIQRRDLTAARDVHLARIKDDLQREAAGLPPLDRIN